MAKLTLTDGTIFEGTTEEIFAITERFNGVKSEEPTAESPYEFKVGDRVEIVDKRASEYHRPARITSGEITDIDFGESFAEYPYRVDSAGTFDRFPASALRKVVDEPKVEPLKVGDYAIVTGVDSTRRQRGSHGFKIGELVELKNSLTLGEGYRVKRLSGDVEKADKVNTEDLRKATDEEVAEAKAKAEASAGQARKEAVFTQAGRKPNEYRKGDIVVVTGESTGEKFYGEIGGKNETYSDNRYYFTQFGRIYRNTDKASDMTPITFIESRLDRN